jgi:signal transduction histidine kinase
VNLILNGIEAMRTSTRKDLLIRSQNLAGKKILLSVSDHGIGISAESLRKMFDPFFTTKPAGLGMGLSISRTLVEAHGGRTWAELNKDAGITVWIELPAETAPQDAE